jgi:hypothetical protein
MLISGAIFADIGLENFSLRLLKSPDAYSCDYDVVNAACLVFFFFFFPLDGIVYLSIFFVLMLYLDLGG